MATDDGHFLHCPLCQGKGEMQRSHLMERLNDPRIKQQLQILLEELKRQEHEELATVARGRDDFEHEVHSWPPRRILWRRSPKE